jgi:hypothetical protein
MSQVHAEKMRWRGGGGEIFPRGIISVRVEVRRLAV